MHRMLHNITLIVFLAVFATTAIKILRTAEDINDAAIQNRPSQVQGPVTNVPQ